MSRKLRTTEISGIVKADSRGHGQYKYSNMFCIHCHGVNKHYPECTKHESYAIPATAEVPSKNSSKRKWDIFKKQFVFSIPVGYWFHIDRSWWYINVYLKELDKRGLELRWGIPVKKK